MILAVFFCLIVFTANHQTLWSLFKVRRDVIGCIDHVIVVGLWYEILLRLSYYIHLGYSKKLSTHLGKWGSNRGPSDCEPFTLYPLDGKMDKIHWKSAKAKKRQKKKLEYCQNGRTFEIRKRMENTQKTAEMAVKRKFKCL